jgi:hypothetical protein
MLAEQISTKTGATPSLATPMVMASEFSAQAQVSVIRPTIVHISWN